MKRAFCLVLFILTGFLLSAQEKALDYYINQGLQNSPLLKEYANITHANQIDSARIVAGYKPQVNGISYNMYAPVINGYGYDAAISNIGNFSEMVSASKQVVSKKNLQNQFSAISLANDSLKVLSKISEQNLRKAITSQYISAYGSWQQYVFNKEVYDLLSAEDTILKKLTQAAVYRQTDYLTFLVTLQQQRTSVLQTQNQFQSDFGMLNYLSGLVDTSMTALAAPNLNPGSLLPADNTVFYEKFEVDSLLLKNADQQIDFNYKPKVSLYADAGFVSTLTYQPYKNFGTSFGVNVNVPIYDGKQRRMQHDKIAIAEQTRENYRDYFKTQYNQQLIQIMQQLESAQRIIDETTGQLKYVETLMQANRKLLTTGDVRIAEYIIAINNYLNAKNVITQNTIIKLQLIAQLNYWNKK